jgi:putative phage-type endonuclease
VLSKKVTEFLPKSSKARWLGQFESDSPEWHAIRNAGVGGSDVGAICGLNKWESAVSLWAKKTGLIDAAFEESEAMEWGKLLEPVVIEKFKRKHPELEVLYNPGTFCHEDRSWQIANPDAIARDKETGELYVIEIKTARYEDEWDEKELLVPPSYRAQLLWYQQTLGIERGIVATLFSGSRYREFPQEFDAFEAEANLQQAERWFMENVGLGTMPDFDGADATYQTVRAIHPDIDPELPDVELGALGSNYQLAAAEVELAAQRLNEIKSRVLDAMGKAKRGLVDGEWTFTRQAKGTGLPYLVMKKG